MKGIVHGTSLLLFCVFATIGWSDAVPSGPLPDNVTPHSYDLTLRILPESDLFEGVTAIDVELKEGMSGFWLHGRNLAVSRCSFRTANGQESACAYKQINDAGVARVDFPSTITPQKIRVTLQYKAPFHKKLEGLYKVNEENRAYAFTQFEAIYARLCFPGFDEPRFKTPFNITLVVKSDDTAITTTLPVSEEPAGDGLKRIRYARTERLPAYLIAFAVGPFDVVSANDIPPNAVRKKPIPLRGVAPRGKGKHLQYALEETSALLPLLEKYFEMPYSFHKIDLIAVPDFDWGAMENAGAITFRESLLLLDPAQASFAQKRSISHVIAHELAHQWFGNIVTMRWWDDIWLNEGFTAWITSNVVEEWNPAFKERASSAESRFSVMKSDSLESARPLHRKVEDAGEIISIADGIIFSKGAAVMGMMEHFAGAEKFRQWMREYVRAFAFQSISSDDMLQFMAARGGMELAESLRTFVYQPGVPLLHMQWNCQANQTKIAIEQERYFAVPQKQPGSEVWKIPICVRTGLDPEGVSCFVMKERKQTFDLPTCVSWLSPNADGAGYYRWVLAEKNYSALRPYISKLSAAEQLSMSDSLRAAFDSGDLLAERYLSEVVPLASSAERSIAVVPMSVLRFLKDEVLPPAVDEKLETFAKKLYAPVIDRLGFEAAQNEEADTKLFRAEVIEFLAFVARDPVVRSEAVKRAHRYVGFGADNEIHLEAVDQNLVGVVLGVAIQESGPEFFERLTELLFKSTDTAFRDRVLNGFEKATDPQLVQNALTLVLDPRLRVNERSSLLRGLIAHPPSRDLAWKWFTQNYEKLRASISEPDAGSLPLIASSFCSAKYANAAQKFFDPRVEALPAGTRNLSIAIDNVESCAVRAVKQRSSAETFFGK